jgi:hypothetical protein
MAYSLKKDPREPDYAKRLPTLRDLQNQTLVADKLREETGPSTLGARTRPMAILLALIGLATFFVPLVTTSVPVMGQSRWSPWEIVSGMVRGNLPAAVLLTSTGDSAVRWLTFANSMLFGSLFIYIMLAGVLVVAFAGAQRVIVGALAALGIVAALIELRGFSDLQLAILGGPPANVSGQQVHALALGMVWFAVLTLVLTFAAWKELEDL